MKKAHLKVIFSLIFLLGFVITANELRAQISDNSIQEGISPSKAGVYQSKGVTQLKGILWKTAKVFEINYANNSFTSPLGDVEINSLGFSDPLFFDGLLYFRLYPSPKNQVIAAVDSENGNFAWLFKSKENLSSPVITKDAVFFISEDKRIFALDPKTGKEIWRFTVKDKALNTFTELTFASNTLFFSTLDGNLYALNVKTQEIKWTFKAKGFLSPPAVKDGLLFVGDEKGTLHALDINDGQEKWNFTAKKQIRTVCIADKSVFFRNDEGELFALDISSGQRKWNTKIGGKYVSIFPLLLSVGSSLSVSSETVFFSGEEKGEEYLFAVNAENGQLRWKTRLDEASRRPIIAEDLIYLGGFGKFYAVNVKDGKIEWSIDAKSESGGQKVKNLVSSPAVNNGKLFLISDEGLFYCLS